MLVGPADLAVFVGLFVWIHSRAMGHKVCRWVAAPRQHKQKQHLEEEVTQIHQILIDLLFEVVCDLNNTSVSVTAARLNMNC